MAEKIYVDGLRTFPKHEKAPEWVLGTLIVTLQDIVMWWKENQQYLTEYQGKQQLRLQMTRADSGKVNLAVDTWKPDGAKEPKAEGGYKPFKKPPAGPPAADSFDDSQLPF